MNTKLLKKILGSYIPTEVINEHISSFIVPIKTYHDNNNINEIYFLNNKEEINGLYIKYNRDGSLRQKAYYKNGILNGKYISYYKNEKIMEITNYLNGEHHGLCKTYNEDGSLWFAFQVEHGIPKEHVIYNEDDSMMDE